jgi:hypothetical protein
MPDHSPALSHDAAERSAGELVLASIRGRQRVAIGAGRPAGDAVLVIAGLAGSVLPVLERATVLSRKFVMAVGRKV